MGTVEPATGQPSWEASDRLFTKSHSVTEWLSCVCLFFSVPPRDSLPRHLPAAPLRCSIRVAYQAADALLPGRAEQARRQAKQNFAGRSYPCQIRAAKARIGRASPEKAPVAPSVPDPVMELEKAALCIGGDSIFRGVCKLETRGTLRPCIGPVRAWPHGLAFWGPVRAIAPARAIVLETCLRLGGNEMGMPSQPRASRSEFLRRWLAPPMPRVKVRCSPRRSLF